MNFKNARRAVLITFGALMITASLHSAPQPKLTELLKVLGMPEESDLTKINEWAQKNLLRSGERWDDQSKKFDSIQGRVRPLLKELGFIDEIAPKSKSYDGVLVHGATLPRVRERIEYLVEQWEKGIRFQELYFLSGERSLLPHEKIGDATTECEMMRHAFSEVELPKGMQEAINVHFVNAPLKPNGSRPNSNDTVNAWIKEKAPVGSYLAISNNPHIQRQDLVVRALIPPQYSLESVGPAASPNEKITTLLDEVARTIFQMTRPKPLGV